jgi:hypothetical protein
MLDAWNVRRATLEDPPVPNTDTSDFIDVPAIARECGVTTSTVRRWMCPGIRVGGEKVRLIPDRVIGSRSVVSRATLERFHAACAAAKYGADAAVPAETPAASLARRKAAQQRVAEQLGGGCSPRETATFHSTRGDAGDVDDP